jgi:hypothetical protein
LNHTSEEIPSVSSKLGTITEETKSVTFQGNKYQVDRYLGIPYAKPPTGDLRFQPPQPLGSFLFRTYNAADFGASFQHVQPSYPTMPKEKKTDEDCLLFHARNQMNLLVTRLCYIYMAADYRFDQGFSMINQCCRL